MSLPFSPPRTPMEARVREGLPTNGWAYEPKWDGFRMLAWAPAPGVTEPRMDSRNQRPLLRYFPELIPAVSALPAGAVVDGEVVVVVDGHLDFDRLQQRIHPAQSRIDMLSQQDPATLVAFDLLAAEGEDLRDRPFRERRERLVQLMGGVAHPAWHLTPSTTDATEAARWFTQFEAAGCDGIVCKQLDGVYAEGQRAMLKVKHRRTADCIIGGYRLHKDGGKIGSILLGLYTDDGRLAFIGHCSGFGDADRIAVLQRLSEYEAEESFTWAGESFAEGVRRPGEPSRWSAGKDLSWTPVRPELVVEVSYDQLTGERFRHATRFERWRPDKDPSQCTFEQLERPEGPAFGDIVLPVSEGSG